MREVFIDDSMNRQLDELGFVIRPLLNSDEVQHCLDIHYKYDPGSDQGKYNTLEINDHEHRRKVSGELRNILERRIEEFVVDYKFIGVNFAVKKSQSQDEFPMHIDDDHCDRTKFRGMNAWVPLIDVSRSNGGLYVVPGSHKLPLTINGIGSSFPYQAHRDLFMEKAHFVEMKAGEALFFDSRMIHGSLTNPTTQNRIAMISGLIPKESSFLLYVNHKQLQENQLELFEVDEEVLLNLEIGKRPEGYNSLGIFEQSMPTVTREDILEMIR